jgi:hypothetical protein
LEVPETGFKNTFSWKKLKIKHCEQMTESWSFCIRIQIISSFSYEIITWACRSYILLFGFIHDAIMMQFYPSFIIVSQKWTIGSSNFLKMALHYISTMSINSFFSPNH